MATIIISPLHCTGGPRQCTRTRKQKRGIKIGQEESVLSIFANNDYLSRKALRIN